MTTNNLVFIAEVDLHEFAEAGTVVVACCFRVAERFQDGVSWGQKGVIGIFSLMSLLLSSAS